MTKNDNAIEGPVLPAIWGRWRGPLLAVPLLGFLGGCASTGDPGAEVGAKPSTLAVDLAKSAKSEEMSNPADARERRGKTGFYEVFGKRYSTKDSSDGHVEKGLASWYGTKFNGRRTSSGERYDMHALTAAHKSLPLPTFAEVTNLDNGRSVLVKINDRGPFSGNRVIDLSYAAAQELKMVGSGVAMVEIRAIDPFKDAPRDNLLLASAKQPAKSSSLGLDGGRIAAATTNSVAVIAAGEGKPEPLLSATDPVARVDREPAAGEDVSPSSAPQTQDTSNANLYVQVGTFGNRANAEHLRRRLVDHLAEQVQVRASGDTSVPLYNVHIGPLATPDQAKDVSLQLAALGVKPSLTVVE